jgi:soluble epoxide hydrolase / lipid-phosphate phosphatase
VHISLHSLFDSQDISTFDSAYVDVDLNPTAKSTLLFVHGWPGLWVISCLILCTIRNLLRKSTWSNQIIEFQDSYHLLVPDLRGFGGSSHPGDVQTSGTMGDLVGDLVCILEHANVRSVTCIG